MSFFMENCMKSKMVQVTTTILLLLLLLSKSFTQPIANTNRQKDSNTLQPDNKVDAFVRQPSPRKNSCDLDVAEVYVYPPAESPNTITQECICQPHTSNCNVIIRWDDPSSQTHTHSPQSRSQTPISSYLISFWLREKDEHSKVCHRLPPGQKFYNFSRHIEFPEPQQELIVHFPFTVSALPIYLPTYEATPHLIVCPSNIKMRQHLEQNSEVCEEATHIFNCSYDAYPMPHNSDIVWTFAQLDGRAEVAFRGSDEVSLQDDNNIVITKGPGVTTLRVLRTRTNHEGFYTCHINSHMGSYYSAKSQGSLRVRLNSTQQCAHAQENPTHAQFIHVCLASVLVIILLVVGITVYMHKPRMRNVPRCKSTLPSRMRRQRSVYISHCSPTTKQRDKVLKLAYVLESQLPDVCVLMDVTKTTEINQVGGLAQWIPQQMSNADKIIIVLSKNYLDALNAESEEVKYDAMTSQVVKVAAEYGFIVNMLHESRNSSNKLIICYEQRGPEDYPALFRGKVCYLVPKVTKETVAMDNDLINILSAVDPTLNCVQLRELCQ